MTLEDAIAETMRRAEPDREFLRQALTPRGAGADMQTGSHNEQSRKIADTNALIDAFGDAIKARLALFTKRTGRGDAWKDKNWQTECQKELLRHVDKGDPLDVAAYAAFCWHHGWPTA